MIMFENEKIKESFETFCEISSNTGKYWSANIVEWYDFMFECADTKIKIPRKTLIVELVNRGCDHDCANVLGLHFDIGFESMIYCIDERME